MIRLFFLVFCISSFLSHAQVDSLNENSVVKTINKGTVDTLGKTSLFVERKTFPGGTQIEWFKVVDIDDFDKIIDNGCTLFFFTQYYLVFDSANAKPFGVDYVFWVNNGHLHYLIDEKKKKKVKKALRRYIARNK